MSILFQNYPNPFHQNTCIKYNIANSFSRAHIYVYNLMGDVIFIHPINSSGEGELNFDSSQFVKGMYKYTLMVDGVVVATKIMIRE